MCKIRILIVDDHGIVRAGIRSLLEGQVDMEVVGEAVNGEDAISKAGQLKPDLVLMDIVLQGRMDGIEAASIIQSRFDIPVVYLTA